MIYENTQKIYNKLQKLKGYINTKTVNKYITQNQQLIEKKLNYKLNPNYFLFFLIFFCGSLFIYHLYTLWVKYQNEDTIPDSNPLPRLI
jgi:hypothetical protein